MARHARAYDQIWRGIVPQSDRRAISRSTGYSQQELVQGHLEVFYSIPGITEEDRDTRYQLFGDYLRVMVRGGYSKDERDRFWSDIGIDPRDFDWDGWREVMGYRRAGNAA